jgi:hypothetical protein
VTGRPQTDAIDPEQLFGGFPVRFNIGIPPG